MYTQKNMYNMCLVGYDRQLMMVNVKLWIDV